MANPLDPVMEWFRTALDSMRVTQRTLNKGLAGAVTSRHVFYRQPLTDCTARLDAATQALDRLGGLALTPIFERTPRDYPGQTPFTTLPPGAPQGAPARGN